MNYITDFFSNLITQDYIIIGISFGFSFLFLYMGVEKVYKSYLGIIVGLFLFSFVNLSLSSLNNSDSGINFMVQFFSKNREYLGFYALLLVPIFAIILPLNDYISFRISNKKWLNFLLSFLFGLIYFSFLICILLSVVNNKFLFKIDNVLVDKLKDKQIIKDFISYFSSSIIYIFLSKYDSLINLIITVFIFYKMTIGGAIDYILYKIFSGLKVFFEKQVLELDSKKSGEKESNGHHEVLEEAHHEEHHEEVHHDNTHHDGGHGHH